MNSTNITTTKICAAQVKYYAATGFAHAEFVKKVEVAQAEFYKLENAANIDYVKILDSERAKLENTMAAAIVERNKTRSAANRMANEGLGHTNEIGASEMSGEVMHTPGPWFISRSEMGIHKYVEARIGGGMIQEVASCGPTDKSEQSDANAILIAAAPEMLVALESAYMAMLGYTHQNDITHTACKKVADAIAKAKGR